VRETRNIGRKIDPAILRDRCIDDLINRSAAGDIDFLSDCFPAVRPGSWKLFLPHLLARDRQ
jgi:hypothetical protein